MDNTDMLNINKVLRVYVTVSIIVVIYIIIVYFALTSKSLLTATAQMPIICDLGTFFSHTKEPVNST